MIPPPSSFFKFPIRKKIFWSILSIILIIEILGFPNFSYAEKSSCQTDKLALEVTYEKKLQNIQTGKVTLTFIFNGARPPMQLAAAYAALARCAPWVIAGDYEARKPVKGDFAELQEIAREKGIMPQEKLTDDYPELDIAIKRLTRKFRNIDLLMPGQWILPATKPKIIENIPFTITFLDKNLVLKTPIESPSRRKLARICNGMRYKVRDCEIEIVHEFLVEEKDNWATMEYAGFVNHYKLQLTLSVPHNHALDIGYDVLEYIKERFPGLNEPGYETWLPDFWVSEIPQGRPNSTNKSKGIGHSKNTLYQEAISQSKKLAKIFLGGC